MATQRLSTEVFTGDLPFGDVWHKRDTAGEEAAVPESRARSTQRFPPAMLNFEYPRHSLVPSDHHRKTCARPG
jgi:hypothetical protein